MKDSQRVTSTRKQFEQEISSWNNKRVPPRKTVNKMIRENRDLLIALHESHDRSETDWAEHCALFLDFWIVYGGFSIRGWGWEPVEEYDDTHGRFASKDLDWRGPNGRNYFRFGDIVIHSK